jgi:hypothetical protein
MFFAFGYVYVSDFWQIYFDKCMNSKSQLLAFEQMHLTYKIC